MDSFGIRGPYLRSRLIVGTGKYRSFQEMQRCHEATGADMVTVAVRRVNLTDRSKESLIDYIDRSKFLSCPIPPAATPPMTPSARPCWAREVGLSNWVKLEVIGDEKTLFPDNDGLLEATRILVKEGFVVLPYTNDDVVNARKLIDAGAAAVMPLAAPIGSGLGIQNPTNLRILREMITSAADCGCRRGHRIRRRHRHGIGRRRHPDEHRHRRRRGCRQDGRAMKLAVEAGRLAYEAGRMPKKLYAAASSPLAGVVGT